MKNLLSLGLIVSLLVLSTTLPAQNPEIEKTIKKADGLYNNDKYDEAEKLLIKLVKKYPAEGEIWTKLGDVQLAQYSIAMKSDGMFNNITITTTDKDGNKIENDSSTKALFAMLSSFKPSDTYKTHLINTFRLACCHSRNAYSSSFLLRHYMADKEVDKNVKPEAQKEYDRAEKEFSQHNYNTAAQYYQKAIDIDSTFYKARLYLGDVYYFTRNYNLAITEFKRAVATEPDLLEPRKYLFDALEKSGQAKKAYETGLESLCVYPDLTMFTKIENAAYEAGIKCTFNADIRYVMPNSIKKPSTHKDDFTIDAPKNTPWKYYTEAMGTVKSYCNEYGLINQNNITNEKYLELYSWQYMLDKAGKEDLKTAREMKEKGFLDCYVFINCFHNDFLEQYRHFVANNREHINQYFAYLAGR